MNQTEIRNCIELLVADAMLFATFGWHSFDDRGSACAGRMDKFDSEDERLEFEKLLQDVREVMPKNSELFKECSNLMANYFERVYVQYDYCTKLVARVLNGTESYHEFKMTLRFSVEARRTMLERAMKKLA